MYHHIYVYVKISLLATRKLRNHSMFDLVINTLFYLAIRISQIQVTIPTNSQLSSYIIYYILELSKNFLFVLILS